MPRANSQEREHLAVKDTECKETTMYRNFQSQSDFALAMPTFADVIDQASDIKATATFNIWNGNSGMVNCQWRIKIYFTQKCRNALSKQ